MDGQCKGVRDRTYDGTRNPVTWYVTSFTSLVFTVISYLAMIAQTYLAILDLLPFLDQVEQ